VVNAGLLVVLARYLEPIWGSTELLRFVLTVNAAVGVLAFCWMMCVFMMTGSEEYLYGRANGFHGVIAAFLVAIKQLLPEHEVRLLAVTRIKLKVRTRAPAQSASSTCHFHARSRLREAPFSRCREEPL
jgi:hypothetical protein